MCNLQATMTRTSIPDKARYPGPSYATIRKWARDYFCDLDGKFGRRGTIYRRRFQGDRAIGADPVLFTQAGFPYISLGNGLREYL